MNDAFARIEDEEEELSSEPMFEDEVEPATDLQRNRSIDTTPFDPFAPTATAGTLIPAGAEEMMDSFRDEDSDEMETFSVVQGGIVDDGGNDDGGGDDGDDGPVFIPMNPDADADLLGSIAVKHAGKATKDAKMRGITYLDGDRETADLLALRDSGGEPQRGGKGNGNGGDSDSDSDDDMFVDDDDDDKEADATGGGLFSRLKSKMTATTTATTTTTTKAEETPSEPKAAGALAYGLDENGNSLPHPDTVLHGHTRDLLRESDDSSEEGDSGDAAQDENGKLFPHPEKAARLSKFGKSARTKRPSFQQQQQHITTTTMAMAMDLDANGRSLPHPDEVIRLSSVGVSKKNGTVREDATDVDGQNLDVNGNSLPHPDEVIRLSSVGGSERNRKKYNRGRDTMVDTDARDLDSNGNSLPHPDTMMGSDEQILLNNILEKNTSSSSSSSSNGSFEDEFDERIGDKERLMAALAESGSNLSEDYFRGATSSEEKSYFVIADDDSDENEGRGLEDNGNSLPPPSGNKLWGNIRRSLGSTFSKNKKTDRQQDVEHPNSGNGEIFQDEEKMNPSSSDLDRDLLMEDEFARVFHEEKKKRKSTLQSMKDGVTKALRPSSATTPRGRGDEYGQSDALFAEADEENIFRNDQSERSDALDPFDDEASNIKDDRIASLSRKERLRAMVQEHRKNPRSRKICIALAAFFLFLIILIPSVTRNKKKVLDVDSNSAATGTGANPATLPPTVAAPNPPVELGTCEDEITLTDKAGADLELNGLEIPCYSIREPIYFRFSRCRPVAPLDWVGFYQSGSIFRDRLWKPWYDGIYLCGRQPCPINDPINNQGEPPMVKYMAAPPIKNPGNYRIFLIKDSYWPFEYVDYTPSFQVVKNKANCPVWNTPKPPPVDENIIVIDSDRATGGVSAATLSPTEVATTTSSFAMSNSGSFGLTNFGTSSASDGHSTDQFEAEDSLINNINEILEDVKDSFGI